MTQDQAIDIAMNLLHNELDLPDDDELVCPKNEETDDGDYIVVKSKVYLKNEV